MLTRTALILIFVAQTALSYEIPKSKKPSIDRDKTSVLKELSRGISEIADHARKGIVFVSVSKNVRSSPFGQIDPFDFFFGPGRRGPPSGGGGDQKQKGLGSGFIIDLDKGYVMTNNHVIDGADEINVKLANGSSYEGTVLGRDKTTDVAIVQIKDEKFNRRGLEELSLMDNSQDVKVGDVCIALGAPFGLEASLSMGVVSAIGRGNLSLTDLGDFIQTDAAINPGNSGGPLLNFDGQVMGMNTAILSSSGGYNGVGFAIPANLAREVANQLINKGKVQRGYLGVMLGNLEPGLAKEMGLPDDTEGALVSSVEAGSPAAKAGIEAGDVITEVNKQKIKDSSTLRNVIGLDKPGKKVDVTYYREGKKRTASVLLGSFDNAVLAQESTNPKEFGIQVASITQQLRSQFRFKSGVGIVVTVVGEDSPADRAGLQRGDVIVKVNNENITSTAQFWKLAKGKKRLLVRIERQGQFLFVPLTKQ